MISTLSLPNWCKEFRPEQVDAIGKIVSEFQGGAKVIVLEGPTGSGKTLVAEAVRQELEVRGLYNCTTKTLQEQCHRDYPYSAMVQGRENYQTMTGGSTVTAGDCTKSAHGGDRCAWCDPVWQCPYEMAKNEALRAELAVLNTAYWLTECNGPGRFSGRPYVVIDEADTLEEQLQRYVSVRISPQQAKRYGIRPPLKVTVQESWQEWADKTRASLLEVFRGLVKDDPKTLKQKVAVERLGKKVRFLSDSLGVDEWVYTGRGENIEFKPVDVTSIGDRFVWSHGQKFLLMSATIISASWTMESLGFDGKWAGVVMPSRFRIENRPVRIIPSGDMGRKTNDRAGVSTALAKVLEKHPTERVLVHSVSYDLSTYLGSTVSGRDCLLYEQATQRSARLQRFRQSQAGVLIAPSLDRGVDLPNDDVRVIIIAKVPYPNLGDRQIARRVYGGGKNGELWYAVQTIRTIVQMTGRGVRHDEDWCVSYILDSAFLKLWKRWRRLFPSWWTEAIDWRYQL